LIDRKIITITHCVSEVMVADFFTKPLQVKRFRAIRDVILNITPLVDHRSVLVNNKKEDDQPKREDLWRQDCKEAHVCEYTFSEETIFE